jgi:hypothetical protein
MQRQHSGDYRERWHLCTCIEAIHTACAKAAATLPPRKTKDPNANWFSMCDKTT